MCCFLVMAKKSRQHHIKIIIITLIILLPFPVCSADTIWAKKAWPRVKHSCVHCSVSKKKVFSPTVSERGRNMVNQWACHTQLISLWKKLIFNHPFLPTSCGHLTSFAQGLPQPIKTPCCAMKAFEEAYASELEIIKAMDTTTLGIAKKMQRNTASVWNFHVETSVSAKQGTVIFIFGHLNSYRINPGLYLKQTRKQRNLEHIFKQFHIVLSTEYTSTLLHRRVFISRLTSNSVQVTLAAKRNLSPLAPVSTWVLWQVPSLSQPLWVPVSSFWNCRVCVTLLLCQLLKSIQIQFHPLPSWV